MRRKTIRAKGRVSGQMVAVMRVNFITDTDRGKVLLHGRMGVVIRVDG
jgi:hypothetical protein